MRLKDGKIKRRGVKEEVLQFMIVKGEEDASEKERAEYQSWIRCTQITSAIIKNN